MGGNVAVHCLNRFALRHAQGRMDRRTQGLFKVYPRAVSYLKKLFNQFSDWQIALAAYNWRENGMTNAVNRAFAKNFWQLRGPRETKNYVPEFIAALIIAKNPQCYGFSNNVTDTFDLDTVDIKIA